MDYSPPGSSVHGVLPARILEWVACYPSGDLLIPGIEPASPASPVMQADSLPLSHGGTLRGPQKWQEELPAHLKASGFSGVHTPGEKNPGKQEQLYFPGMPGPARSPGVCMEQALPHPEEGALVTSMSADYEQNHPKQKEMQKCCLRRP